MQDQPLTQSDLSDAALALAQAQAKKDADLMEALKDRPKPKVIEAVAATPRILMNRAQRRAQVKAYSRVLAMTERQVPVVNPTIVPKSKRRRQPGQRGSLQHA